MTRVLLVCPESVGPGRAAGVGIRILEMARVLRDQGHDVTVLSADAGSVEGCRSGDLSPASLRDNSTDRDVVIVQGHIINDVLAHARKLPMVVDLYDPFIVENLHYYSERGSEVFLHDHATLMKSLAAGDLFLCASEAQRFFYLGLLLATGRVNPEVFASDPHLESLLRLAPFGVQRERASIPPKAGRAILFGGIYDWYDPIAAIDAVAAARRTIADVTLTFTTHPNAEVMPQSKLAAAMDHVRKHHFDFVEFAPWVAYGERTTLFDRHVAALLTFPQSLETDLAMRTRIYDYLWAGLPVISASAPGTNELIERYGVGSVVRNGRFDEAIVDLLADAEKLDTMATATKAFVRDHQWETTLQPLVRFCREPRADTFKESFAAELNVAGGSLLERLKRRIGGRF